MRKNEVTANWEQCGQRCTDTCNCSKWKSAVRVLRRFNVTYMVQSNLVSNWLTCARIGEERQRVGGRESFPFSLSLHLSLFSSISRKWACSHAQSKPQYRTRIKIHSFDESGSGMCRCQIIMGKICRVCILYMLIVILFIMTIQTRWKGSSHTFLENILSVYHK